MSFRKTGSVLLGSLTGGVLYFALAYVLTNIYFAPAFAAPAYVRGVQQTIFFGILFGLVVTLTLMVKSESKEKRLVVGILGLLVGIISFLPFFLIFIIMMWFYPKVAPLPILIVQQATITILAPLTFTGGSIVLWRSLALLLSCRSQIELKANSL